MEILPGSLFQPLLFLCFFLLNRFSFFRLCVSCGANISDFVAQKAVKAGSILEPVEGGGTGSDAPFFIRSVPTHSELRLANSYSYDKPMDIMAWRPFLGEEFSLDHPAANPFPPARGPQLKLMSPLDVGSDHCLLGGAVEGECRSPSSRVQGHSPCVFDTEDAAEDTAGRGLCRGHWDTAGSGLCGEHSHLVKKYISIRGHKLSY
ncbi:unnamed protein product [Spirodela intermedia]|uniref:Uncharacterized protein n=1 Tax=Spirodela intermedia TaxID=51605 RepID=A0A7I8JDH9_SPIIN|nr:unnamed protein product [Spirodela intermedia]CAA6668208.1 unnamed protein product [Spirodela intermedia]